MKKGLTEMVFILDKSGSMAGLVSDTIGGFNGMLEKQKKEEGEALVSTVLFSDDSRVVHDRVDIREVQKLTEKEYYVGGCTALIDAIGGAIKHIKMVHRYIREEDRPENTLFVITTDGLENASRRYSSAEVKAMIEEQKKAGWEFIFLGANIDAVETARHFGIDELHTVNYMADSAGVSANMEAVSRAASTVRRSMPLRSAWKADAEADYEKRKKK